MDILQTFEIFLRMPLSVLHDGFIQILHVETDNNFFMQKSAVNVDFVDKKAQLTVVNNQKVYSLLRMVMYRAKQRELERQNELKRSAIR